MRSSTAGGTTAAADAGTAGEAAGKAGGGKAGARGGANVDGMGLAVGGGGDVRKLIVGAPSLATLGRMLGVILPAGAGVGTCWLPTVGVVGGADTMPGLGLALGPPGRREMGGIWIRAVFFVT